MPPRGGAALSGAHLAHRLSRDVDLFCHEGARLLHGLRAVTGSPAPPAPPATTLRGAPATRAGGHALRGLVDWLVRADRLLSVEERAVLLSPPRLVARFARFAWAHHAHRDGASRADDPTARDPELVDLFVDLFRVIGERWFGLEIEGAEHIPEDGPVLFVGNHSGALLPTDGFFVAVALRDRFGPRRALHPLVHDFLFEDPLLRRFAGRLGMLRAGHDAALSAFRAGGSVLVYPGSDYDAFRPFRERGRVVLGGRKGFLRLALRAQVPIVPVLNAGTHEQLVVLTRGDAIARALRMHAWARTEVFPIVLSFPWGLTSGFVPYLPLPAQTTIRFGPPLRWPDLGPEAADDPRALARCYDEVAGVMQGMLDDLSRGRRFLIGRGRPKAARRNPWHSPET